ncbi:bifunctional UDP-N-acetylglucosamine diphosphorylase/glucosamine-1-phosphate N-acetyltransferase GlmU [Calorimonas adulescens]|uniref:Bifunctional protein GlmU n=1 Tax=Calorimonas adulescens TaxID=2606906 RepID=A0A5D8QB76_9THEO|nr:bifunctional UDP-N-acetylglucosamine diphosphorylase/glucosamine-1-phosphate N-acetyltransferase GlmU [Calorimonas adulescens]TZE81384.1 bifunctional UDP-N-acetylglucosamine diphosphorylase/glucosamine-1-phosphate N-acetyltransferase GlmU [Calorimonas adulescens]
MRDVYALILAAGQGKRMKSKHAKVMHVLNGKPIIDYCVEAVTGITKNVVVVVGSKRQEIMEYLGERVRFCIQEEQLGSGHAAKVSMDLFPDEGTIMVLPGDVPLIKKETLASLLEYHREGHYAATILSCIMEDPSGYGRIVRDNDGNVLSIVEDRDASEDIRKIKEINSAVYCFELKYLKNALEKINNHNDQGEYYLTDTIAIIKNENGRIGALMGNADELSGINDRVQLAEMEKRMNDAILKKLMRDGVTIMDPDHTYISGMAKIGKDVVIYPGTVIEGSSIIGEDCVIGPYTRIISSRIGKGTNISYSVVIESTIGDNTNVGPFAYLRPNSNIGDRVKIGDFVEVKNSNIGDGTKVPHLAYVGDADIGSGVNFSCGAITVNYDGRVKHRTRVADRAFIGCNVNLIAPVEIEEGAFVAAGSTITEKVPQKALGIARCRQTNIEGWVIKKFKE